MAVSKKKSLDNPYVGFVSMHLEPQRESVPTKGASVRLNIATLALIDLLAKRMDISRQSIMQTIIQHGANEMALAYVEEAADADFQSDLKDLTGEYWLEVQQ